MLDVVPGTLSEIYIEIGSSQLQREGELLDKNDRTFTSGGLADEVHSTNEKETNADARGTSPTEVNGLVKDDAFLIHKYEENLRELVRDALRCPRVVRAADTLRVSLRLDGGDPLQLTMHVLFCEPIAQGLIRENTRVILTLSRPHGGQSSISPPTHSERLSNGASEREIADSFEGSSFVSAAEEDSEVCSAALPDPSRRFGAGRSTSSGSADPLFWDDVGNDVISLKPPSFILPRSRAPGGAQAGHSRPHFRVSSSSIPIEKERTSPRDGGPSRLLRAAALQRRISDSALHPRPSKDADDECRVFVEVSALIKLGCFSGDWVRIEAVQNEPLEEFETCNSAVSQASEDLRVWRVAKMYGLPREFFARFDLHNGISSNAAPFAPHTSLVEVGSIVPALYVPPLLLANLSFPTYVRVCPLMQGLPSAPIGAGPWNASQSSLNRALFPPVAKEVTLLKLSTPFSTDRSSQSAIMVALKSHFEERSRLVKSGDLVGVSLNISLKQFLSQGQPSSEEQTEVDELISNSLTAELESFESSDVHTNLWTAWFKIGDVLLGSSSSETETNTSEIWGGTVAVDPSTTRMVQAGTVQDKLPSAIHSLLKPYLGMRRTGVGQHEAERNGNISRLAVPYVSSLQNRLRDLISVAISPHAIHLSLPPLSILLYSGQRGVGKSTAATQACADLGMHVFTIDAYDIVTGNGTSGADVKTEGILRARIERASNCGPENCAVLVQHIEAMAADRVVAVLKDILDGIRVFIATATDIENVPAGLRGLFTHELELSVPDERERKGLLLDICAEKGVALASDVDMSAISLKTAALVAADLVDVVDRAIFSRKLRVQKLVQQMSQLVPYPAQITVRDVYVAGGDLVRCVTRSDFDEAVDAARKNFSDSIGAPKIPTVTWDDVGGLVQVKDAVMETIQLPLEHPQLFSKGLKKRSGILFYGPPGTGKTLLAKAIATELSLNFFSVKGPELLNMYIGESEANVRRVFQRARDARPCVIFFDELDSVAPKRGNQGDSGGVMDRIVSQLLAELDGMSDDHDSVGGVFVIGATNRPDLLDPALLRPGRFDKMLYLGISDTHEKQLTILEALTRKYVS